MRRCSKWWRTRGSESWAARKASPSIPLAFFFLLIGFAVLERASFALSLSRCRGIDALLVRLEAPTRHSPERRSRRVATLRAGKPRCRPARERACVPAIERCTPRARCGQRRSRSTSARACVVYPNGYVAVKLAALAVRPRATWFFAGDPDLSVIHGRSVTGRSDMSGRRVTSARPRGAEARRRQDEDPSSLPPRTAPRSPTAPLLRARWRGPRAPVRLAPGGARSRR